LILATKRGNQEVVRFLLENCALLSAFDKQGKDALAWAKQKRHSAILKLLGQAKPCE
jgi:hypothetical protein